jgi:hypothetical protein
MFQDVPDRADASPCLTGELPSRVDPQRSRMKENTVELALRRREIFLLPMKEITLPRLYEAGSAKKGNRFAPQLCLFKRGEALLCPTRHRAL